MTNKSFVLLETANHETQLSNLFRSFGFTRNFGISSRPDFIVIPNNYSVVHPNLYNSNYPPRFEALFNKENDYEAFSLITAAKLEGIPVIGLGKGALQLHVHNGGSLENENLASHSNRTHPLYDFKGNRVEDVNIFSTSVNQYISLDDVNSSQYYDDVLLGPEDAVESFICSDRLQLGVIFDITYGAGQELFKEDLFKTFKDFL